MDELPTTTASSPLSLSDPSNSLDTFTFSVWDYVVFIATLLVSALIGVFYAIKDAKKQTNEEFLHGGRNMSVIPVALSLIASFISAISITGMSSEWYTRGWQFFLQYLGGILAMFIVCYTFLPVFFPLGLTSIYEYLEMRYQSKSVRIVGMITSLVVMLLYMSVVLYAPALAINAVTQLPVWASILLVGGVCTFYTAIGGLKAVIWTDVFQSLVMYAAMLTVIIWGSMNVGGFDVLWRIVKDAGRIDVFNWSADPTEYQTSWGIMFNGLFLWLGAYGTTQPAVQRYCSMSSIRSARIALLVNIPGFILIGLLCGFAGFAVFANYHDCDPLAAGIIKKKDQILPYFIIDKLRHFPGVPGLFVASLLSGALSSVSSGLNSMAAVLWNDVLKFCFKHKSEAFAAKCCKVLALVAGLFSIAFAFVVTKLGGVLQTALMLTGSAGAPLTGLFILAVFFSSSNWLGALVGILTGHVFMITISSGRMTLLPILTPPYLKTSTDGCPLISNRNNFSLLSKTTITNLQSTTLNSTDTTLPVMNVEDINVLYRISYLWYPMLGALVTVIVGLLVSYVYAMIKPGQIQSPESRLIFAWSKILPACLRSSSDVNNEDFNLSPHKIYYGERDDSSETEYEQRSSLNQKVKESGLF